MKQLLMPDNKTKPKKMTYQFIFVWFPTSQMAPFLSYIQQRTGQVIFFGFVLLSGIVHCFTGKRFLHLQDAHFFVGFEKTSPYSGES